MARRRQTRPGPLTRAAAPDDGAGETVRIERIAAGGDGIGHLQDGRAVFVPRSAPGDLLELAQVTRQRSFARARIGRIVEPGPDRVSPRCPHYERDRCGGCQLQHLGPDAQRDARRVIVGDALRRVGRLEVADPSLEPAASDWEYRARITLHQSADGRRIGFHRLGQPGEIFDLETCHITEASVRELWSVVRLLRRLLPARFESLTLRLERGGARHLLVRGVDPAWPDASKLVDTLRARLPNVMAWWQPPEGAARVVGESEAFPATVFEQVNPPMGDRVRAWAVDALGDVRDQAGWDLYAGIGDTSRMLLERGARLESVEADARAVRLAESNKAKGDLRAHAAKVENVIDTLRPPDFVITNPPRTGMDARAVQAIAASSAGRLVYVSCDPATLGRDLRGLGDGWRLTGLKAFDLFPQTAHVETVAVLERA
jgi:23S rRNA (uracil1939-C5)-methyltransferase